MKLSKIWFFLFVVASSASAAEVIKTDGEVLAGSIEALQLGESLRIRTGDGKLYEIQWKELRSIDGKALQAPPPLKRAFWQKSWYVNLIEVGPAAGSYPASMEAKLNAAGALPDAYRSRFSINLLGLYWPVGAERKLLLGGMVNATGDGAGQGDKYWRLFRDTLAVSALYFPFGKIGDHLYLRGDLGYARISYQGPEFSMIQESSGVGLKAGIGYAVPMGRFVRPLLGFNYSLQNAGYGDPGIDLGTYQGIDLSLGLLW